MSKQKIRTIPDLSITSPLHVEAVKSGEDNFRLWERNVIDKFKNLSDDEIRMELKRTAMPFAVCFEAWIGDFNKGTGIRNANAFNAKEVFYVGDKKWDRRSAVGVYNYTPVTFLPTIDDLMILQDQYVIVGIDNIPGSVPLQSYDWQPNSLMVFGEEGTGLTTAMRSFCKDIVYIEQFGSVRSLNCGTASGIIMYDFVRKMNEKLGRH